MNRDNPTNLPTEEELDKALRAFWAGSPREFDALLERMRDSHGGVCEELHKLIRAMERGRKPGGRRE